MSVKLLLSLSLCFLYGQCSPSVKKNPLVSTPTGKFEGNILTSRQGKTIKAFRGIRYAEAPIGELRFKVSLTHILKMKFCLKKATKRLTRFSRFYLIKQNIMKI